MYMKETSLLAKNLYTPLHLGSKYSLYNLKLLGFVHFSLLILLECSSREMKFQAGPKQSANQWSIHLYSQRYTWWLWLYPAAELLSASRRSRTSKDMNEIVCQNAYRRVDFCYSFAIPLRGDWEFYQHHLSLFLHLKQTRWTALQKCLLCSIEKKAA